MKNKKINNGVYYTPLEISDIMIQKLLELEKQDNTKYKIVDTSVGSGNLIKKISDNHDVYINDITENHELKNIKYKSLTYKNALTPRRYRKDYNLKKQDNIIVIANPPYNDTTSLNKSKTKEKKPEIDPKYKKRDLGQSFLLSYIDLDPKYIIVIHPWSYLIKKTNYNKEFFKHYKLKESLIFSSSLFLDVGVSSNTFPIAMCVYEKGSSSYEDIMNFKYEIYKENKYIIPSKVEKLQDIYNLKKYPDNKEKTESQEYVLTYRDVSSLRRNRFYSSKKNTMTFVINKNEKETYGHIKNLKDNIELIPYYLMNFDPFGNLDLINKFNKNYETYIKEYIDYITIKK